MSSALILIGCTKEIIPDKDKIDNEHAGNKRIISLTTSMPSGTRAAYEDVQSRIALEQVGKAIALSWEPGDEIQLSFIQDDKKIKQTVPVTEISPDRKTASFHISIPTEITGIFDLYGVYGGGGIDEDNPTLVKFPDNTSYAQTLESIQEREDVMLYFAETGLDTEGDLRRIVEFIHLGSLFSITIKNVGTENLEDLSEARLTSSITDWALNSEEGLGIFNMVDNTYQGFTGNYISFSAPKNSLVSADSITFWGWHPTLPEVTWPELSLELLNDAGQVLATSSNIKDARSTPTAAGMSYYFYALWDNDVGSNGKLQFTDHTFNGVNIILIGGHRYANGFMQHYPNLLIPDRLWEFEDWFNPDGSQDVYSLYSVNDMKTYTLDYFAQSADNSKNIDFYLQVFINATNGRFQLRTTAYPFSAVNNTHSTSDGTKWSTLYEEREERGLIFNNGRTKQLSAGFDFGGASEEHFGSNPAANGGTNFYNSIDESNPGIHTLALLTGASSTAPQKKVLIKQIKVIDVPSLWPTNDLQSRIGVFGIRVLN